MSVGSGDDERTWAAEKRDFVADWRDGVADGRDTAADERERITDAREAELDRWERRLKALAAELGVSVSEAVSEADPRAAREERSQNRVSARQDRERDTASRGNAGEHRRAQAQPSLLATAFAGIAEQLYMAESVEDVLQRIAESAVSAVSGCGMASITLWGPRGYSTAATTHAAAKAVDVAQYESDEGPCLDAVESPMVDVPAFPDDRWPILGSRPIDSGVHSAVSFHLSAASPASADPADGSLNAYGLVESAFDDTAREIGFLLAAHATVAVRTVTERTSLEDSGRRLQDALMSRDVIGQAKGILMERLKVSPDDAFEILRRASQGLNQKLREVAAQLVATGELQAEDQ